MKQDQQVGNGETAPRQLLAGLAKRVLQHRGVRHGTTGAIDPQGAMAQPAPLVEWLVLHSLADRAEQVLEHRQRELHARLAIGGSGDVALGEVPQVGARRIPMQHLDKKQLDRLVTGSRVRSRHR